MAGFTDLFDSLISIKFEEIFTQLNESIFGWERGFRYSRRTWNVRLKGRTINCILGHVYTWEPVPV